MKAYARLIVTANNVWSSATFATSNKGPSVRPLPRQNFVNGPSRTRIQKWSSGPCRKKPSKPVRKSISESGAIFLHLVILGENAAVLTESIGKRPHRHAIELASRRWRRGRG